MPIELRATAPAPLTKVSGKWPTTVAVVVIKIGSSSLVDRQGRLDAGFLDLIAAQFAAVARAGRRPVLVTSGAVASCFPVKVPQVADSENAGRRAIRASAA